MSDYITPVMFTDPEGNSIVAILLTIAVSTLFSAIDGGISASLSGQDFWLGFAAGAIGGVVGGVATVVTGSLTLGRGINSLTYGLLNETFQNRDLKNMDWALLAVDVGFDMLFTNKYMGLEDIGMNTLQTATQTLLSSSIIGIVDGVIDIFQSFAYDKYHDAIQDESQEINYATSY